MATTQVAVDFDNDVYPKNSIETFDELLVLTREGEEEVCVCKFSSGLHKGMDLSDLLAH